MSPRERMADEMEDALLHRTLGAWFPRCAEDAGAFGGFHQSYDRAWNPLPDESRSLVFAARMTWTCATIAEAGFPGAWREWTIQGVEHLRSRFHAGEGRFHWTVDLDGAPTGEHVGQSVLYGLVFAIYGLAAAARVVPETGALDLAKEAFSWFERGHRDGNHPSALDIVGFDEAPVLEGEGIDAIGTPYGRKSQNSALHLMEALTELYRVLPEEPVRTRLREAIAVITEGIFLPPGGLSNEMERDGTPTGGPASLGHEVEAGHLILAAEAVLNERTPLAQERARLLIRTAQGHGFRDGSLALSREDETRISWVQSENLLALATLLAEGEDVLSDLEAQWAWFRDRQIDPEHGGLFGALSSTGEVLGDGEKGNAWKAAYHDTRGLLYSARLLRGGATGEDPDVSVPVGY